MANRKQNGKEQVILKLRFSKTRPDMSLQESLQAHEVGLHNNILKHLCRLHWTYLVLDTLSRKGKTYSTCWLRTNPIRHFRKEFHQQTPAQRMFCGGLLNDSFCEPKPTPLECQCFRCKESSRNKAILKKSKHYNSNLILIINSTKVFQTEKSYKHRYY